MVFSTWQEAGWTVSLNYRETMGKVVTCHHLIICCHLRVVACYQSIEKGFHGANDREDARAKNAVPRTSDRSGRAPSGLVSYIGRALFLLNAAPCSKLWHWKRLGYTTHGDDPWHGACY